MACVATLGLSPKPREGCDPQLAISGVVVGGSPLAEGINRQGLGPTPRSRVPSTLKNLNASRFAPALILTLNPLSLGGIYVFFSVCTRFLIGQRELSACRRHLHMGLGPTPREGCHPQLATKGRCVKSFVIVSPRFLIGPQGSPLAEGIYR